MVQNLAGRNGKSDNWKDASKLNRTYQQALIDIRNSIENPSDETRLAIIQAERIGYEVEKKIGENYRQALEE